LPLISYTALVVAAILLPIYPERVLFSIAAVTMLLLFMGIHNAGAMSRSGGNIVSASASRSVV